ncbi:unnamed protein product, partial [Ectocarpus sp. 12 AP-2014]
PAGGERHHPGGQDPREDDDPRAQDGDLVLLKLPAAQARAGQLFLRCGGKRFLVVLVLVQPRDHHTAPDVLGGEEPHGEVLQVGSAVPESVHEERRGGVAYGVERRAGCFRGGVY